MIIKCCKGCSDREIGCHSYCERYKKEKQKVEDQRLKHMRQVQEDRVAADIQYNSIKGKQKHEY